MTLSLQATATTRKSRLNIGAIIRTLREARALSQGDVERRSGLLRSYISRVEGGGTTPSLATIEKLAKVLEVEPYQLLYGQLLYGGNGRPRPAAIPDRRGISRSASNFLKAYQGLSVSNRRIIGSLMSRLARR